MVERRVLGQLPASCKPVSGQLVSINGKLHFENHTWYSRLTRTMPDGTRVGKEPKLVSAKLLAASGHPPRSATTCIKTYLKDMDMPITKADQGMPRLKALCLECSSDDVSEVRLCTIINCPLWAHRLGSNPHNFHKRHQGV